LIHYWKVCFLYGIILIDFLKEHKYTDKKVYECCLRLKQQDPNYLNCLDFILATSEYQHFYDLMREYASVFFNKKFYYIKTESNNNEEKISKEFDV